jgi:bifunctional polynucleotide phosphatase/kinase
MEGLVILEHRKIRKEREKLAIFDMDWTLIKPREGRRFPKNAEDWQWLRASVPGVVRGYAKKGYRVVILTDQSKDWKVDTVRSVLAGLDVPAVAIVAFAKELQKPGVEGFMKVFGEKGYKLGESVYVGDAAGRDGDWAGVDKEVAQRLGVGRFMVPEEAFPLMIKNTDISLLVDNNSQEVVIMVGYPGSGKTTLAKQFEETGRYFRVDGDKFGTSAKMLREGELGLAGGLSVVFDSTNGTREKRKGFIEFARRHGLGVRCVWVDRGIDEAMEQERERVWRTKAKKIPEVVFYTYRKRFEEPLEEEGCLVVRV